MPLGPGRTGARASQKRERADYSPHFKLTARWLAAFLPAAALGDPECPGRYRRIVRPSWGLMNKIKVALVGVGNCASSLVQGRYFYAGRKAPEGLMHERLGG